MRAGDLWKAGVSKWAGEKHRAEIFLGKSAQSSTRHDSICKEAEVLRLGPCDTMNMQVHFCGYAWGRHWLWVSDRAARGESPASY
jgi:hypothetical protein